jgi:arsenical pump membrane protein
LSSHAHTGTVLADLVGADAGPMITPFDSLATMLVLALARREGEEVRIREFVRLGLWAVPLIVLATAVALAINIAVAR